MDIAAELSGVSDPEIFEVPDSEVGCVTSPKRDWFAENRSWIRATASVPIRKPEGVRSGASSSNILSLSGGVTSCECCSDSVNANIPMAIVTTPNAKRGILLRLMVRGVSCI